jgi:hypothetical protein
VKEHAVFVRKAMALLLSCVTLLSGALPALAQSAIPPSDSTGSGLSLSECGLQGRLDAQRESTALVSLGSFLGGFAGGLLLGPIGGVIAYKAQGMPAPPVPMDPSLGGPECEQAYRDGYGYQVRSWKRHAAVGGAVFGTAIFGCVILIAISIRHRSPDIVQSWDPGS